MTTAEHTAVPTPPVDEHGLQRRISWTGAFWIASGVPAVKAAATRATNRGQVIRAHFPAGCGGPTQGHG